MGKRSKNKGSAFERKIAEAFNERFAHVKLGSRRYKLRRVPASGGLDIKADIYDPYRDDFPYWIECKNRSSYRLQSLLNGKSELYRVLDKTVKSACDSEAASKYVTGPYPIVVFRGGDFKDDMVMYRMANTPGYVQPLWMTTEPEPLILVKTTCITLLASFLASCKTIPLCLSIDRNFAVNDEDDGEV